MDEIHFVLKGRYVVGYLISSKEHYAKMLGSKSVIGDKGVMFNERSEFLYKAISDLDCYILRKQNLLEIFNKYKDIALSMKV